MPAGLIRFTTLLGAMLLCSCNDDPLVVLGRFDGPRAPGSAGSAGSAGDAGSAGSAGSAGASAGDGAAGGTCEPPMPLQHYAMSGTGTEVVDLRGGASGEVLGGAILDGSGELILDGEDDYVNLPNSLMAGFAEVTVVLWLRYFGGPAYVRIFDFGVGSDGEDPADGLRTVGRSYLSATPGTGFFPPRLAALITSNGSAAEVAAVTNVRLDAELHMVSVAVSSDALELYDDAVLIARVPNHVVLADIEDVNNWLGRSQYDQDPYLRATYSDVRIYDRALLQCALDALRAAGPD